ncbi:MAG: hypothetical protein JXB05_01675 [Myxococcaceae bacterium]|nr:hypothetical protein [Myxococcaceae bacterium]
MSIRRTTSETPIQPPKPEPATKLEPGKGEKPQQLTPHVNQLKPRGADENYVNGAFNCAPAVVAMLARAKGDKSNMTDAELITDLGAGIVTKDGTTPEGVARMLGRADVDIVGNALAGQYDEAAVKEHLQDGNKLIAQIGLPGENGAPDSSHYVLVQGMNRDGNYVISDPLASGPRVVTPEQLREAVTRAPPDGGLLLPVEGNGGSKETAAPEEAVTQPSGASTFEPALARRVTDPSMPAISPAVLGPGFARAVTDPSLGVVDSASFGPALSRAMPAIDPAALLQQPAISGENVVQLMESVLPALNPATLAVTNGFAGPIPPALVAPEPAVATVIPGTVASAQPPAGDPFAVPDKVLAGIDTTFQEVPVAKEDKTLTAAEKAAISDLDIDYGKTDAPATASPSNPLVPENVDLVEYGKNLRNRRGRHDPWANRFLERLEGSHHHRDMWLLHWMKRQDLRDPGTGKKTWTDSW